MPASHVLTRTRTQVAQVVMAALVDAGTAAMAGSVEYAERCLLTPYVQQGALLLMFSRLPLSHI